jgi:hypothetical protein
MAINVNVSGKTLVAFLLGRISTLRACAHVQTRAGQVAIVALFAAMGAGGSGHGARIAQHSSPAAAHGISVACDLSSADGAGIGAQLRERGFSAEQVQTIAAVLLTAGLRVSAPPAAARVATDADPQQMQKLLASIDTMREQLKQQQQARPSSSDCPVCEDECPKCAEPDCSACASRTGGGSGGSSGGSGEQNAAVSERACARFLFQSRLCCLLMRVVVVLLLVCSTSLAAKRCSSG